MAFLVDGRVVNGDNPLELDTASLAEGAHVLRAVAYRTGLVRSQIMAEQEFTVTR